MSIKLSAIKDAVTAAAKQNREAFAEIGTKIADLNKQIDDLIEGQSDPDVTDAAFEASLAELAADAKALADIVPGTATPSESPEPSPAPSPTP